MEESDRRVTRKLLVPLTPKEFEERAVELAGCDKELDELDVQKKQHNDRIKQLKGQVQLRKVDLSKAVQERVEKRDVECEWQENFKQKCWQLVRLDTHEVVDTMAMTVEDLQGKLPGADGEKKKGGKKGVKQESAPDDNEEQPKKRGGKKGK